MMNSWAATPHDFTEEHIDKIWNELWRTRGGNGEAPKIDNLADDDVAKISGKWVVAFGKLSSQRAVLIERNGMVAVSGEQDGDIWQKSGQWKLIGGKLVLFLERDSMPCFVFEKEKRLFIFDPGAQSIFSELKRMPKKVCKVCGAAFLPGDEDEINGDDLDSLSKLFHHYGLHGYAEAYVIDIETAKFTGGPINEMQFEATIVEPIQGIQKAGERITFNEFNDGDRKTVQKRAQDRQKGLWCVVGGRWNGKFVAQDSVPLVRYNDDLKKIVNGHNNFCNNARQNQVQVSGTIPTSTPCVKTGELCSFEIGLLQDPERQSMPPSLKTFQENQVVDR